MDSSSDSPTPSFDDIVVFDNAKINSEVQALQDCSSSISTSTPLTTSSTTSSTTASPISSSSSPIFNMIDDDMSVTSTVFTILPIHVVEDENIYTTTQQEEDSKDKNNLTISSDVSGASLESNYLPPLSPTTINSDAVTQYHRRSFEDRGSMLSRMQLTKKTTSMGKNSPRIIPLEENILPTELSLNEQGTTVFPITKTTVTSAIIKPSPPTGTVRKRPSFSGKSRKLSLNRNKHKNKNKPPKSKPKTNMPQMNLNVLAKEAVLPNDSQ